MSEAAKSAGELAIEAANVPTVSKAPTSPLVARLIDADTHRTMSGVLGSVGTDQPTGVEVRWNAEDGVPVVGESIGDSVPMTVSVSPNDDGIPSATFIAEDYDGDDGGVDLGGGDNGGWGSSEID